MERELKFRAWNKDYSEMSYFELHETDRGYFIEGQTDITKLPTMQFIGLKDKNGAEVYEGDVIELDSTIIGGKAIRGKVIWNNDTTMSRLEWGVWTKKGYYPTDFMGYLEVIGNIYENPELLNTKS